MQSGKLLARQFIQGRAVKREPIPSMNEIRRQLGMELIEAERAQARIECDVPAILRNQVFI